MQVGGFLPFTMIDYPGKLSAVVFTQGCPLRCPYCHNPELQTPSVQTQIDWGGVLLTLEKRKSLLDGVVFSGGEPLMQPDIEQAMRTVKDMGFLVGLHTSGVFAEVLEKVLPLTDWVGLDIKAPFDKYAKASGTAKSFDMGKRAERALGMILASRAGLEVRTTTDPRVVSKADILSMADVLSAKGVKHFVLQEYRPVNKEGIVEPTIEEITDFYTDKDFLDRLENMFDDFRVRRG